MRNTFTMNRKKLPEFGRWKSYSAVWSDQCLSVQFRYY